MRTQMWRCMRVLFSLVALAVTVTAANDVFNEEEPDAPPPPPPPPSQHRGHNDVFPLDEDVEVSHHRLTTKHHKIHNIVLHPHQNSMCELKPIRQIVTHALCKSREMENNVCVGTCFSYTVPQTEPETPGDELLDYCDSCQASESHWTTIQMDCEEYGNTYQVTKKIQMITNCSCSSCHPREQQTTNNNEVYNSNNEPRVTELFYKMLPEALQRPEMNRELDKKRSLDELRKFVYKLQYNYVNNEDEEDPNVVVSY